MHATLFMDRWRKDSIVLLYHHVVAVLLIFFTFSTRAHQAATITFFLHDFCDIWLEGTKCVLYFKDQGDKTYQLFEHMANVGFVVFSITWFWTRLYTFPLRLLWICTTQLTTLGLQVPLMFMLNCLLYMLLGMNIYWFSVSSLN
jgi:ceramide synthetase